MNPAQTITADAVAAWLVAQTAALNLPKAQIIVSVSKHRPGHVSWLVEACDQPFVSGDTLGDAVALLRAKIKSPAAVAAEKRAAAQKLLDEAAQIEAAATPADAGRKEVAA